MIYIYDIMLNWSKDKLYDFFEWEKKDKLSHIKRIPIFKIEKGLINNFYYNEIKLEDSFISKFYNMTEVYSSKKIEKLPYACLISDGFTVLAIKTDKSGKVIYRSKLLVDEEEEILCISQKLNKIPIKIEIGKQIDEIDFLTRDERKIKVFLTNEIKEAYKKNENEKINYIYTECFGKSNSSVKDMYKELLQSLDEINSSHKNIYNILQLISNKK